ncbi:MAG: nucleotidyl transferase AbiEii/AbiGii toxin family protein [Bacteroidota bacterium]
MKLYTNTVSPLLLDTLHKLMAFAELSSFRVVGGTALSLQLGHRESDDIDLFTDAVYGSVDFEGIDKRINENFLYVDASIPGSSRVGKPYFIGISSTEFIKVDVFYTDQFLYPILTHDNLRLAALEDIIIMKLGIISCEQGGRKKDFWDLHELLNSFTLGSMIALYLKHSFSKISFAELLQKLTDFTRADDDFTPRCLKGKYWELIKVDFEEEVFRLKRNQATK